MTKIEWVKNPDGTQGVTLNPVKGLCPMACHYCYARRMYKRFKWNPEISWCPQAFNILDKYKTLDGIGINKPSRIFVGSTFELFLESLPENWMEYNLATVKRYPQHTFIFLTKKPQNLIKWSPFPDNCWVGVSADTYYHLFKGLNGLRNIKANIKFISFEPLLESMSGPRFNLDGISWIIIGAMTPHSEKTAPHIGWVREIVEAADKAGIPVFLKNNLLELVNYKNAETDFAFNKEGFYRQEMPCTG